MYNKINNFGIKKILIIISLLLLASCSNIDNTNEAKNDTIKNESIEVKNDLLKVEKVTISDVKQNLDKRENIELSNQDLNMLNQQISSLFNSKIKSQAIEKKDASICEKSDKGYIKNCKMQVITQLGDPAKCEKLSDTNYIEECKNTITQKLASKDLNEKYCEKLIDDSEEKVKVSSCKERIMIESKMKKEMEEMDAKMKKEMEEMDAKMKKEMEAKFEK